MVLSFYLSKIVLVRIIFALAVLALLGLSLDLFKNATDLVTQGGILAVLEYAAIRTPQIMVTLFSVAVLIGGITAFLSLGYNSEMTIIRASGYGIFLILWRLLPLALILGGVYSQFGDRINSWSEARLTVVFPADSLSISTDKSTWVRDGRNIVRMHFDAQDGSVLRELTVFKTNDDGQVIARLSADYARYKEGRWHLENSSRTQDGSIVEAAEDIWQTQLLPKSLQDFATKKKNFSADDARNALSGETASVKSDSYYITRIKRSYAALLSPGVILILAALSGFGSSRAGGGAKLAVISVVIGFVYIVTDGIFGSLGEIGLIEPNIAAFTPSVIFAAAGAWYLLLLDE